MKRTEVITKQFFNLESHEISKNNGIYNSGNLFDAFYRLWRE